MSLFLFLSLSRCPVGSYQNLYLWEWESGNRNLQVVLAHQDNITCIATCSTSSFAASVSNDRTAKLWDCR